MNRRTFISASTTASLSSLLTAAGADKSPTSAAEPEFTAGSGPGPVLTGHPVVCGPSADCLTILQPLQRHATGYLEYAIDDGPYRRVDAIAAGLLPFEQYVLKFRMPVLPPGRTIRYRITGKSIGWVPVREFVYGKIVQGEPETGPELSFRALDPNAESTSFVVWNDTHENVQTLNSLHKLTAELKPDFLLWNGDQSNDIHLESKMSAQFLVPNGLAVANRWPLAYVRGNHDVRGPAARHLPQFTGTPEDRYYYGFRSGPLAALVMDTGEDKPDDSPWLGGITAFAAMREQQKTWLESTVKEPWFREAPIRILFCHIPLWFTRELPNAEYGEYSKPCRESWLPALTAGGVHLVISGHTHDHKWMPAKAGQPIPQLIGGGPAPKYATLIHGTVSRQALTLRMMKLDGSGVADVVINA